ncbi:GNAT family N-acetyltransferase [Sphingomonas sp. BN140010]|uniref:GNAT family N-acetyltransferase n=1 Tax=Sphingomonas arvum TaxID=2992113 RepID=A0ABT3JGE9_9SPHN|nr:GNAT family N-acetyltransferase [Sphingomonas sp. BN140010]MCW3798159.1 GNAT family N-acetyltransferase [Sphingomonas sp. BN140010]
MTLDADQLAELAANRGLKLKRSRVRTPGKPGYGLFALVDGTGEPVFGLDASGALQASAEEVESQLRGLEKHDWATSLREAGGTVAAKRRKARAAPELVADPPPPPPSPPPRPPKPVLREAKGRDSQQLAELFALLGHEIATERVRANLELLAKAGEPVLVMADGEQVIGACGYHATPMPHRDPTIGRITVLVLTEGARGRGLGRQLVAEAERRLAQLGCGIVEVTSNDRLREAHAFYRHLGYERTSMRFAKALPER